MGLDRTTRHAHPRSLHRFHRSGGVAGRLSDRQRGRQRGRPGRARAGPCPAGQTLAEDYRSAGTTPGRRGAQAVGPVSCAAGFAAVTLHSVQDTEAVHTIFRIGPPLRFLAAGSGPVCTDDTTDGSGGVVVPHAAAARLGCITTPTAGHAAPGDAGAPVLGAATRSDVKGYGQVRPSEINNDGDGTSLITNITWSSWGPAHAIGTGTALYVAHGQINYQGSQATATVVATDLGQCAGRAAYRHVSWYFPQHGQHLDPTAGYDACNP